MTLTVNSVPTLKGSIDLPASKSYSIRAFLAAACGGRSLIVRPSDCDDAKVALRVARKLGARVSLKGRGNWLVEAHRKSITGMRISVGESGTVLRFVLPLLALSKKRFTVTGKGTLNKRPNHHLAQTLRTMGAAVKGKGAKETTPITVSGKNFKGGRVRIDGSLSSQFISALLIAAPQLKEKTQIEITGKKFVSEKYITMTAQILKRAGIAVAKKSKRKYIVRGGQAFKGLNRFVVPSDYGLAAFFMVAACLTKSEVVLRGSLKKDLVQSDGAILNYLRLMGAQFKNTDTAILIKGPATLKGGRFSLKDAPDLVPIMTIAALFADGKTKLCDIAHVRAKESDRISDLRDELLKIGADIREKANALTVYPKMVYKRDILLDPHNDHRLAMAFSILGLKLTVRLKNIKCVSKSYPRFFEDFEKLGARLTKS